MVVSLWVLIRFEMFVQGTQIQVKHNTYLLFSRHEKTALVCRRDGGDKSRMRTMLFKAVFLFHKHLLHMS